VAVSILDRDAIGRRESGRKSPEPGRKDSAPRDACAKIFPPRESMYPAAWIFFSEINLSKCPFNRVSASSR